jgi:hypothetical protein
MGFAAPLLALAGSAVAYVVKQYADARDRRRNQFFELMQFVDSEKPIATKVAAIYELRRYPEHKDFVIRFCRAQRNNVTGLGAPPLIDEMDQTRAFMEALNSN